MDEQVLQINEQEKPLKKFKALKIIAFILYALATAFALIFLLDVLMVEEGLGKGIGVPLWIYFCAVMYLIIVIYSLISFIVVAVNKKRGNCEKGVVRYFVVFTVLPIITYALGFIILLLLV